MINVEPLISLPAFMFGFLAVLLIGRAIAEVFAYYSEQNKRLPSRGNDRAGLRRLSPSQKTIQRYYNTYRKGA